MSSKETDEAELSATGNFAAEEAFPAASRDVAPRRYAFGDEAGSQ